MRKVKRAEGWYNELREYQPVVPRSRESSCFFFAFQCLAKRGGVLVRKMKRKNTRHLVSPGISITDTG